jgi:hypothetical protein
MGVRFTPKTGHYSAPQRRSGLGQEQPHAPRQISREWTVIRNSKTALDVPVERPRCQQSLGVFTMKVGSARAALACRYLLTFSSQLARS